MSTRRIAYWWFRFVFSGRFLETFLIGRRRPLTDARSLDAMKPQQPLISPTDEAARIVAE